jgi:hemolysin III
VSIPLGLALVIAAPSGRARLAALIYAFAVTGLLSTSATYHRIDWRRPRARAWMRRLDHSMIFVLIAGTYTPFSLLVLHGTLATAVLIVVWAGALGGIVLNLVWISAPKWVTASVYVALGWVAVIAMPQLAERLGAGGVALLMGGGLLYTAGAVIYATQRPNPSPAVFGYHEIFHALVLAAAAAHFAVVAFYALPS